MKINYVCALAIVCALVASALAGVASATVIQHQDSRNLYINSTNLGAPGSEYYVGEEGVQFFVEWRNGGDSFANDTSITNANCSVATAAPVSWVVRAINDDVTIPEAGFNTYNFNWFEFDVNGNAKPGTYNMSVTLRFKDSLGSGANVTETEYILFNIVNRVDVYDVEGLLPGDIAAPADVYMEGNGPWPDGYIEDMEITLTKPDTDFSWFGEISTSLTIPVFPGAEFNDWDDVTLSPLMSVSANKNAGSYIGSYVLTYVTEDGVLCTESGNLTFEVGHIAMLGVSTTTTSIDQGALKVTFAVTVTNTGTVNLAGIKLKVDPASSSAGAFLTKPADHWEGDETVSYDSVTVGNLAVDASVNISVTIGFKTYIPAGQHKIMFGFEGFYEDPLTTFYRGVDMWWQDDFLLNVAPFNPHIWMDGYGTFNLLPEKSSIAGPFFMLDVVDSAIDVSLQSTDVLYKSRGLVDNQLDIKVQNYGNIEYDGVVLTMLTNSDDSPFLNVVDASAPESEPVLMAGTLTPGLTTTVTFRVTLRNDAAIGVFNIPVKVTALNADMGEMVNATLTARVTIAGIGPKLVVTSVDPVKVKPGSNFVLTLTIENQGDDTARNVVLFSNNGIMTTTGNTELNGDLEAPVPIVSPIVLEDMEPGANVTVMIEMRSNEDMSSGHVYQISLGVSFMDSYADEYAYSNTETTYFKVSVKATGGGGSSLGNLYFVLMLVGIVAMIVMCIFAVVWARKNWVPRRKRGGPPMIHGPEQPAPPQN